MACAVTNNRRAIAHTKYRLYLFTKYLKCSSTGKWGGFSSLPGWTDGLRCEGFSCLTVAVTCHVCKEASGEPKKGAVAVTWLPYRYAAVGVAKVIGWRMTKGGRLCRASLKGWLVKHS